MSQYNYDLIHLIKKYDTPLMLFDQDIFEERVEAIKSSLEKVTNRFRIYYAAKAFFNTGMGKLLNKLGLYLDASSFGEIYIAIKSGFPPERINFHGNNKKEEELFEALKAGVGTITVDSVDELRILSELSLGYDFTPKILLRVNPGVAVHTNEKIRTGCSDSKFGIPYDEVEDILLKYKDRKYLEIVGLHAHVGSQIDTIEPFIEALDRLFELYQKAHELDYPVRLLNLGGGFGITYKNEKPFLPQTLTKLIEVLKDKSRKAGIEEPIVCFEPGRFLAGPSGKTLYTIGTIKEVPQRTYLSVDGGLYENPRTALYDARYDAYVLERELDESNRKSYRVCGRTCESDVLIPEIDLASPKVGEHLVVSNTGAYNYSMSSNYNQYPRPAVVLLRGGRDSLLVAREDYEDLTRKDKIPDWLK